MKLKYLGTAAAEAVPAFFCSCDVCEKSRKAGGRNIRSRSQALINDDLMIDFNPDTYMHMIAHNVDLRKLKTVLITHGHEDHLYPPELSNRASPVTAHFPNDGKDKVPLDVYISGNSLKILNKILKITRTKPKDKKAFKCNKLVFFKPFETAGYTVTALKAHHAKYLDPAFFIVQKDGRTLLYANDTGYFPKETWEYLESSGVKFDFVSLDCTSTKKGRENGTHMDLATCCKVKDRLLSNKNADEKTVFCLNHFSHNGGYTYDELVPIAKEKGFLVSYDGMECEI